MFTSKCPGQDSRNLTLDSIKCVHCGEENEIFSNELRVKCTGCGEWVYKQQMPSCLDWCAKAKECVGAEKWAELRGFEGKEAKAA